MKKTKTKILLWSAIVVLVLIMATMIVTVIVLKNKDDNPDDGPLTEIAWDGVSVEKPTGQGTKENPYVISKPENLAYMATEMNYNESNYSYYTLACDLNMGGHNWTPIGDRGTNIFCGDFNGNGYTIKNLGEDEEGYYSDSSKQAPSLFGKVKSAGICNVTVEYAFDTAVGTIAFGGIAREAYGLVDITSCGNTSVSLTFKDCDTEFGFGGILGYAFGSSINVKECYSLTSMKVVGSKASLGGIIGRVDDPPVVENRIKVYPAIKDSYFAGKLSYEKNNALSTINVGLFVGEGYSEDAVFSYCTLKGVYSVYDLNGNQINTAEQLAELLSTKWMSVPSLNNGLPIPKIYVSNI